LAHHQGQHIQISGGETSGFSVTDTKRGWVWHLPEHKVAEPGSGGQVYLFDKYAADFFIGEDKSLNMNALIRWPAYVVMKKINSDKTSKFGDMPLAEAVLTKFLADQDIGPPCTIMPCDSQNVPIFTGMDEDENRYVFVNRMTSDLSGLVDGDDESGGEPDNIHYFKSLEKTLGQRMDRLLKLGLLFTDIKLENVLMLTRYDAEAANNDLGHIDNKQIYKGDREEYFLTDFDLTFACHLFSETERNSYTFKVQHSKDESDEHFSAVLRSISPEFLAAEDEEEENIAFSLPAGVEDFPVLNLLHEKSRECKGVNDKRAMQAYRTIMKGMIGGYFSEVKIFPNETQELVKLIKNLTILNDEDSPRERSLEIENKLRATNRSDISWLISFYGPFARRIPFYAGNYLPFRLTARPGQVYEAFHDAPPEYDDHGKKRKRRFS
tara:strand:+ start:2281 stop:3591 length:1311 start_codon:yes stop_codon:yes gene_type:complete